eukprot:Nk52_evm18s273 gene=Nk52_evmTU18s273
MEAYRSRSTFDEVMYEKIDSKLRDSEYFEGNYVQQQRTKSKNRNKYIALCTLLLFISVAAGVATWAGGTPKKNRLKNNNGSFSDMGVVPAVKSPKGGAVGMVAGNGRKDHGKDEEEEESLYVEEESAREEGASPYQHVQEWEEQDEWAVMSGMEKQSDEVDYAALLKSALQSGQRDRRGFVDEDDEEAEIACDRLGSLCGDDSGICQRSSTGEFYCSTDVSSHCRDIWQVGQACLMSEGVVGRCGVSETRGIRHFSCAPAEMFALSGSLTAKFSYFTHFESSFGSLSARVQQKQSVQCPGLMAPCSASPMSFCSAKGTCVGARDMCQDQSGNALNNPCLTSSNVEGTCQKVAGDPIECIPGQLVSLFHLGDSNTEQTSVVENDDRASLQCSIQDAEYCSIYVEGVSRGVPGICSANGSLAGAKKCRVMSSDLKVAQEQKKTAEEREADLESTSVASVVSKLSALAGIAEGLKALKITSVSAEDLFKDEDSHSAKAKNRQSRFDCVMGMSSKIENSEKSRWDSNAACGWCEHYTSNSIEKYADKYAWDFDCENYDKIIEGNPGKVVFCGCLLNVASWGKCNSEKMCVTDFIDTPKTQQTCKNVLSDIRSIHMCQPRGYWGDEKDSFSYVEGLMDQTLSEMFKRVDYVCTDGPAVARGRRDDGDDQDESSPEGQEVEEPKEEATSEADDKDNDSSSGTEGLENAQESDQQSIQQENEKDDGATESVSENTEEAGPESKQKQGSKEGDGEDDVDTQSAATNVESTKQSDKEGKQKQGSKQDDSKADIEDDGDIASDPGGGEDGKASGTEEKQTQDSKEDDGEDDVEMETPTNGAESGKESNQKQDNKEDEGEDDVDTAVAKNRSDDAKTAGKDKKQKEDSKENDGEDDVDTEAVTNVTEDAKESGKESRQKQGNKGNVGKGDVDRSTATNDSENAKKSEKDNKENQNDKDGDGEDDIDTVSEVNVAGNGNEMGANQKKHVKSKAGNGHKSSGSGGVNIDGSDAAGKVSLDDVDDGDDIDNDAINVDGNNSNDDDDDDDEEEQEIQKKEEDGEEDEDDDKMDIIAPLTEVKNGKKTPEKDEYCRKRIIVCPQTEIEKEFLIRFSFIAKGFKGLANTRGLRGDDMKAFCFGDESSESGEEDSTESKSGQSSATSSSTNESSGEETKEGGKAASEKGKADTKETEGASERKEKETEKSAGEKGKEVAKEPEEAAEEKGKEAAEETDEVAREKGKEATKETDETAKEKGKNAAKETDQAAEGKGKTAGKEGAVAEENEQTATEENGKSATKGTGKTAGSNSASPTQSLKSLPDENGKPQGKATVESPTRNNNGGSIPVRLYTGLATNANVEEKMSDLAGTALFDDQGDEFGDKKSIGYTYTVPLLTSCLSASLSTVLAMML